MLRTTLVALSLLLSGCMGRVYLSPQPQPQPQPQPPPGAAQRSDARPRLWYVGVGLFDESWSEGDVAETGARLAQQAGGFQVSPTVLSYGADHRYQEPDRAGVDAVTADIARRAGPVDVVLLYVSTHGAPGQLAREGDRRQLESVTPDEVQEWLAPLGRRPTILVLSACFAGSFIPDLRADNRIILAAARRDRTSFGCRAGAEHTVFGTALLNALATPSSSWHAIVDSVRGQVARGEHELGVTLPSEPQVSVGPAVTGLFEAPLF